MEKMYFLLVAAVTLFSGCLTINDHLTEQMEADKSSKYVLLSDLILSSPENKKLKEEDRNRFSGYSNGFKNICRNLPCPPPCPEGSLILDDCNPGPWDMLGFYAFDDLDVSNVEAIIGGDRKELVNPVRLDLKGSFDYIEFMDKSDFRAASSVRINVTNMKSGEKYIATIK